MKEKIIIFFLILIMLFFSTTVLAIDQNQSEDKNLGVIFVIIELLVKFTNEIYEMLLNNFNKFSFDLNLNSHAVQQGAANLLTIFLTLNLYKMFEKTYRLTPYMLLRAFGLYLLGIYAIHNYQIVFEITEHIKNSILTEFQIQPQTEYISLDHLKEIYLNNFKGEIPNQQGKLLIDLSFLFATFISFTATLGIAVLLFLRNIHLAILRNLAPLAISTIASTATYQISTNFIKQYILDDIKIYFIVLGMNIFISLADGALGFMLQAVGGLLYAYLVSQKLSKLKLAGSKAKSTFDFVVNKFN